MFTRRPKLSGPLTSDDLPEVALSQKRKKTSIASPNSGDEIEKISQDFQVAQLESLKALDNNAPSASVSPKVSKPPIQPIQPPTPIIQTPPVKPLSQSPPSKPPTRSGAASAKPMLEPLPRYLELDEPPSALLKSLLNEIVEQDIRRLRERLTGEK